MSRRHRANGRKSMPYRPWIVAYSMPYSEEERCPALVVARCPSQAVRVWRERWGLAPTDFDIDELSVERAQWRWGVPEPACPQTPCEWSPEGKLESGEEMFRGYGLYFLDDVRCDACDEMTSDERITYANFAEADDVPLCPDCLAECREKGEVLP